MQKEELDKIDIRHSGELRTLSEENAALRERLVFSWRWQKSNMDDIAHLLQQWLHHRT